MPLYYMHHLPMFGARMLPDQALPEQAEAALCVLEQVAALHGPRPADAPLHGVCGDPLVEWVLWASANHEQYKWIWRYAYELITELNFRFSLPGGDPTARGDCVGAFYRRLDALPVEGALPIPPGRWSAPHHAPNTDAFMVTYAPRAASLTWTYRRPPFEMRGAFQ